MQRMTYRRAAAVLAIALLVGGAAACGSSDSKADKGTDSTTTAATNDGGSSSGSDSSSGDDASSDSGSASKCVADSDRISGSSTVIWTADSISEHSFTDATEATTALVQADGSIEPSKLTVKVGEVFAFGLAEGNKDIVAIKVGCDGGQTVLPGDPSAGEYITAPGTYDIVNDIEGKTVGSVTVTG